MQTNSSGSHVVLLGMYGACSQNGSRVTATIQNHNICLLVCCLCTMQTENSHKLFLCSSHFVWSHAKTSNDKTDYAELLFPQRHLNPKASLPPDQVLLPSVSQPVSPEDIPPALPYRPNNLRHSAVLTPNRLYPSLEEGYPHVTSSLSATVMLILVDCFRYFQVLKLLTDCCWFC